MPALPSVPNVIVIKFRFTIGEDLTAACRLFWRYAGTAPTVAELATFNAALATAWASDMASLHGNGTELTEITTTDLSSATGATSSDVVAITGTRSGANLPADIATLVSQKISRRYRGGHPRVYFPFGTSTDLLDAQTWTTAFVSAVNTGTIAFATALAAAVWSGGVSLSPVNVSYYEGFTVHTGVTGRARNVATVRATPIIDVIISQLVQQGIASQRKRLLRKA